MPHALQSQDIMEGLDYLAQRLSLMPLTCTEEPERKEYPDGIGITITRPDFSLSKVIPIEDGLFNIFFMSYSREKRQGYAGYEFNISIEEGAKLSQKELDGILQSAECLANIPPDADGFVRDLSEFLFASMIEVEDSDGALYTRMVSGIEGSFSLKTLGDSRLCLFTYKNGDLTWMNLCTDETSVKNGWKPMTETDNRLAFGYFQKVNQLALQYLS